ncbi:MAG: AtpZ/AtpI family protein [Deltaproteobacteria bacterium]|nr:AtpZ/AtpI family protein [Deltaproteobacteria bacterium]
MTMTPLGEDKGKILRQIASYSTLGLEMGLSVAVGAIIGYYLDKWLHTDPWLLIVFLIFGVIAGFRSLYRALKRLERENKED